MEVSQLGPENKGINAVEVISIRSSQKKAAQTGIQMLAMNLSSEERRESDGDVVQTQELAS